MAIAQVLNGKFPRNFSIRFSGGDSHNSDLMVEYIAQKVVYALDSKYRLQRGRVDKSGSLGQWYLWEYGLQSTANGEFVAQLRIKQPWGGKQIWFWVSVAPLPQFANLPEFKDDNIILNYLRYNP